MRLAKLSVIAATGAVGALTAFGAMSASASTATPSANTTGDVTAAASCFRDDANAPWSPAWRCANRVGAPIYSRGTNPTVIDRLRTNPSWFNCRKEGQSTGGGGPHPNRWVWTQGDDFGRWGWVKDSDIADETNPIRVCPF
ncbi:MAG: hypothetical protein GEV11_19050 [Streptosporangiales bacterium]|nr:hypothetical protein [Streptosporangiales bacterium]